LRDASASTVHLDESLMHVRRSASSLGSAETGATADDATGAVILNLALIAEPVPFAIARTFGADPEPGSIIDSGIQGASSLTEHDGRGDGIPIPSRDVLRVLVLSGAQFLQRVAEVSGPHDAAGRSCKVRL
jgi:hypothetical protein